MQSVKIGIETERDSLRHLVTLIGNSTLSAREHDDSVEDDRRRRWPISESKFRPLCGHKGGKNAKGWRNDQESRCGKKREPGMEEAGDQKSPFHTNVAPTVSYYKIMFIQRTVPNGDSRSSIRLLPCNIRLVGE